jgi:hypothetical protein
MPNLSSTEKWESLIKSFNRSGLSKKAFCEQHGISPGNFHYHKRKLEEKATPRKFYPLVPREEKAVSSSQEITLELPHGIRLTIKGSN